MQSDRDKEQTRTVGVGMAEDVAGVDLATIHAKQKPGHIHHQTGARSEHKDEAGAEGLRWVGLTHHA